MEKLRLNHYFDACTLDSSADIYDLIINKLHQNSAIVSHLAIGEACGRALEKGESTLNAFVELITSIRDHIKIVGNDGVDSIVQEIWDGNEIKRIGMTDAIHLATAIKHGCSVFKTADRDFSGACPSIYKAIALKHNITDFSISKVTVTISSSHKFKKKRLVLPGLRK
jgi:predicted nucleic acid-binding protein